MDGIRSGSWLGLLLEGVAEEGSPDVRGEQNPTTLNCFPPKYFRQ